MRKLVGTVVLIWLSIWVMVGMHLFYFLERSNNNNNNIRGGGGATALSKPISYPMCHKITHLPTSLGAFDCGFNLMEDTDYLPDPELVRRFKENHLTVQNTVGYLDRQSYFARIQKLQNPVDCAQSPPWHSVKFTSHGHGVNLFHLAVSIGNHYDRNIPVVASRSAYRFGSHAELCNSEGKKLNRGWSCHFSPLSQSCQDKEEEEEMEIVNWSQLGKPHPKQDWCKPHGVYVPDAGRCKCNVGYLPTESGSSCGSYETDRAFKEKNKWKYRYEAYHNAKGDDDYAMQGTEHWVSRNAPGEIFATQNERDPATWPYDKFTQHFPMANMTRVKLKYGFFWWILQNSWLLHKDAPKRAEIESETQKLLFPHDQGRHECIAVQVRRGDSCNDVTAPHRTCPKLQVYVDRVDKLKRTYGITKPITIFLASDDPSAIEEAKLLDQGQDVWVWQPISRQKYVNGKVVDNNPALFDDATMDELYYDLWAISQCELGFVTSFASSVAWNAYAMAVGRFGYYIPFISVDLPWGHKILGEHHAKGNLFDGTVHEQELEFDRPGLLIA
ncbi:hypothetical protein BASA81_000345 [Batrachochytrium salamandrivorans]|nr:hypothetical protein BASA81_000345 [Batrachochytrium salamandrivorans]